MICRTHFLRRIGWLTTSGMNVLQALVSGVLCDRATLLTEPWLMFLRAPVTPAEPWSFSTGSITILLSRLVIERAQVRAEVAVVLGVVALVDQVHLDELVAVVAGDRVVAEAREVDQELRAVVLGGQAAPPDAVGDGLVHLRRS